MYHPFDSYSFQKVKVETRISFFARKFWSKIHLSSGFNQYQQMSFHFKMEILSQLYCNRLTFSVLRKQKSICSSVRTQSFQVGFRFASSTKKDQQKKPLIKHVNLMLSGENHLLFPKCEWAFSTREPRDQIIVDQALLQAKTVEKRKVHELVELDAHSRQEKNNKVTQKLGPKEFAVVPSRKDEYGKLTYNLIS